MSMMQAFKEHNTAFHTDEKEKKISFFWINNIIITSCLWVFLSNSGEIDTKVPAVFIAI